MWTGIVLLLIAIYIYLFFRSLHELIVLMKLVNSGLELLGALVASLIYPLEVFYEAVKWLVRKVISYAIRR